MRILLHYNHDRSRCWATLVEDQRVPFLVVAQGNHASTADAALASLSFFATVSSKTLTDFLAIPAHELSQRAEEDTSTELDH